VDQNAVCGWRFCSVSARNRDSYRNLSEKPTLLQTLLSMVCPSTVLCSIICAMCSSAAYAMRLRDSPGAPIEALHPKELSGLLDKAKAACSNSDRQRALLLDPSWAEYSLHDLLLGAGVYGGSHRIDAASYACGNHSFAGVWPRSLYCEFHREFPGRSKALMNLRLLNIVKRRIGNTSKNEGAVVHIRMGDVIDDSNHSLEDMMTHRTYFYDGKESPWNMYVMPLDHYRYIADQITPGHPVILVGAPHAPGSKRGRVFYESCRYTFAVAAYLEQKGHNVQLRIGHLPDDDFVFFVNSKLFVPGGGRYSKQAADLVRLNGGRVLYTPSTKL